MTQIADLPVAPTSRISPQERVDAWLSEFETVLATRDIQRATRMFAVDSFWRDLVSFTWNLKTMEGRDAIGEMLENRLTGTDPSRFRTREPATDDGDGVCRRSSSSRPRWAAAPDTCESKDATTDRTPRGPC